MAKDSEALAKRIMSYGPMTIEVLSGILDVFAREQIDKYTIQQNEYKRVTAYVEKTIEDKKRPRPDSGIPKVKTASRRM